MISFKYWKLLQENVDINLGVKSPANLGVMGEAPMLGAMFKRMDGEGPDAPGMKPPMGKSKPIGKPPMGDEDMGDEEGGDEDMGAHDTDDEDMGDDEGDDEGDEDEGDEDMHGDMGDDEGDEDEGDEDMHGDMGGDEDMHGDMGGDEDMGKPPMGRGKPPMGRGKPPMGDVPAMMRKKMSYMKKEGKEVLPWEKGKEDADDKKKRSQNVKAGTSNDEKDKINANKKKHGGLCKKCDMMDKGEKCCSKKMTKEQTEFLNNLTKMTGGHKFAKDELGFWVPVKEDLLIPNEEPLKEQQPKPGEAGYAPSQYMGLSGGGQPTYQEWLGKKRK